MNTTLKPIEHRDAYTRAVEREINAWFREAIFTPLLIVLRDAGVSVSEKYQAIPYDEFGRENAISTALEDALKAGTVQYANGIFSGKFSSAITRELRAAGATFDSVNKTFHLAPANIPLELRGILAQAAERSAAVTDQMKNVLQQIAENLSVSAVGLTFERALNAITADMGRQLMASVSNLAPEQIGLVPVIDDVTRTAISEQFTNNLNLHIKGWAQQRIPELRARVEENAFKYSGRTDRLAKIIEAEFGVTRRKAEFLADQETGLLVSKYRAAKYGQLGITEYIWSTSRDSRVRPTHARLEGKRFAFATGAIVTEPGQPARYCNPGEDYRCRCVPRPIINLAELAA